MPIAAMPNVRQSASSCVLINPFRTMLVASMAEASVTRRPWTMRVCTPSLAVTASSWGPPPWTRTTRIPR
jgi:hypothetical protein